MVTFKDVEAAKARIGDKLAKTELIQSIMRPAKLKLECRHPLGSFKIRGAISKISSLTDEQKKAGVIAVSSGNHGGGVSLAAKLEGIENAVVYVPIATPKSKTDKIEMYGAKVIRAGNNYDECHKLGFEAAKTAGLTMIDPCSDVAVIAGQGTAALEILEDFPEVDVILAPIGGGGLIAGVAVAAKHIKPDIKIVGVQTAACPAMVAAIRDNVFYEEYETTGETICDALVGGIGRMPYDMRHLIDEILVVEEDDIRRTVASLLVDERILAEGAGAASVAAFDKNMDKFEGKNVAIIVSGGNIDKTKLATILTE